MIYMRVYEMGYSDGTLLVKGANVPTKRCVLEAGEGQKLPR